MGMDFKQLGQIKGRKWVEKKAMRQVEKYQKKVQKLIDPILDQFVCLMVQEDDNTAEMLATTVCIMVITGFEEKKSQDAVLDMLTNTVKEMQRMKGMTS